MLGSPVKVASQLSLIMTAAIVTPSLVLNQVLVPTWPSVVWIVASGVVFAVAIKTEKIRFEITRSSSREDWEFIIEGLAAYFVVGGVLIGLFSALTPPISQTVCVQPYNASLVNCLRTQTATYIVGQRSTLLGSLDVLAYYEIVVGLIFSMFFLAFLAVLSRLSIESDYYP